MAGQMGSEAFFPCCIRRMQRGMQNRFCVGEEDYGSTDFEAFLREKRKKKVRLCTLRLLCPAGLSDERREKLERYLAEHTKGCESDETWQVVLLEHGNDRELL